MAAFVCDRVLTLARPHIRFLLILDRNSLVCFCKLMTAALECEQKSSNGGFVWIALAAVPLVYVLSIGPVGMVAQRSGGNHTAIRKFYAPIGWLHDNTFMRKPLEAYLDLWGVK